MMNLAKYGMISQNAIIGSGIYMTITDYGMSQVYRSINAGTSVSITGSSIANPVGVAMSSNGQYQTIAAYSSGIWNSIDYGVTWTQVMSSAYEWQIVAMSSNGQYQLASDSNYNGYLWRSTNYGATWFAVNYNRYNGNWYGVAVSDTGQYMLASGYGTSIYWSSNFGIDWNMATIADGYNHHWRYIASTSSGNYAITCDWNYQVRYIYKTSNAGYSWTAITGLGDANWICVAGGGSYFLACNDTYSYLSTDNGTSWSVINYAMGGGKTAAISRDGKTQTIIDYNTKHTWRSTNYGATWTDLGILSYSTENIAISDLVI